MYCRVGAQLRQPTVQLKEYRKTTDFTLQLSEVDREYTFFDISNNLSYNFGTI